LIVLFCVIYHRPARLARPPRPSASPAWLEGGPCSHGGRGSTQTAEKNQSINFCISLRALKLYSMDRSFSNEITVFMRLNFQLLCKKGAKRFKTFIKFAKFKYMLKALIFRDAVMPTFYA
jgi:hypothetical protein